MNLASMITSSRREHRNRPVRRNQRRRLLTQERLEPRVLLAALEGDIFALPRQIIDPVGLVGTLSASVRWGDGTEEAVPVSTPSVPNKIQLRFDYSLDTSNFFTSSRRTALEQTGRSVVQHFTDQLSAIIPSGDDTWSANVCHPSQGPANLLCGVLVDVSNRVPRVAANEVVIFPGARDIIGNVRGTGGIGGFGGSGTQAWLDTVAGRGQAGALTNPQTDVAPWGGSISFDNKGTDWYFGADVDGIGPEQIDFRTVAAHELLHVLGFGLQLPDKTSAWERLTPGSTFNGERARNTYVGSGFPPVDTNAHGDGPSKSHWAESIAEEGQATLMRAAIPIATHQSITRLDLAALDDLGWQVTYPEGIVIKGLEHVYGDDAKYDVELILRGSASGEVRRTVVADIVNVAPTLTVPSTQTVMAGESLSLPQELFQIVDPGFGTSETFTYTIDWKDGTERSTGEATITQVGDASRDTIASFSAAHAYDQVGIYQVTVTVTDDNGGSDTKNFTVEVTEPPALSLSLSKSEIAEDQGKDAATLTVTRSGRVRDSEQTITLTSSDPSEATVPDSVVIPAGQTSVTVGVSAQDDALLDGTQAVTLTASASGVSSDKIELSVSDAESLRAEASAESVIENDSTSFMLTIFRSNTDNDKALEVIVSGGNPAELEMPGTLLIESGKNQVAIPVKPIDDDDFEPPQRLGFTFTAANYASASVEFDLLDDEPPLFQNPDDRFDVDARGTVTSADALRVINVIGQRQGKPDLDPENEQPDGVFVDATGDYKVTALDALVIINEIAKRLLLSGESEFVPVGENLVLPSQRLAATLHDDDTLTTLALDPGRIF